VLETCIVCHGIGLRIINVANPATPVEIGFFDEGVSNAKQVAVSGDYAYIVDDWGPSLILIINVDNPAAPTLTGSYEVDYSAGDITIANNYAFILADGLYIINIANPANPSQTGFFSEPGGHVTVADQYAYVTTFNGLRILNVSNPSAPTETGYYETQADATDMVVVGNYAYITERIGGLRVISVSNPTAPSETIFYETVGGVGSGAVAESYAYVINSNGNGLFVIDVTNPAQPEVTGSVKGFGGGVAVADDYAYVTNRSELFIIDVTNPTAPAEVGIYDSPAWNVAVEENYAYLAERYQGLRIVDLTSPSKPSEAGFYSLPGGGWANDVAVSIDYAYVIDDDGWLHIINVDDPAEPYETGAYDAQRSICGVTVLREYAYRGVGDLRIINVADPANPTLAGSYEPSESGYACYLAVDDNHAFVIADGLYIVDVTNPSNLFKTGFYDTPGLSEDVAVSGDIAFVADEDGGLLILRYTESSKPPIADFSASPTGGTPPLVFFENLSTGDYDTCKWDFGGGLESEECNNPSAIYTEEGDHTISLTLGGPGGEDTKTEKQCVKVGYQRIFLPGVMGKR